MRLVDVPLLSLLLAALPGNGPAALAAQHAIPAVTLDPILDTSEAPVGTIVRTAMAYWRLELPGRTPTDLWSAAEQQRAGDYDLTARFLYQGYRGRLIEVSPTWEADSAYVLKTVFARVDSSGQDIHLLGVQRLYAVREAGRWVLMGALRRLTREWPITTVGRITYHRSPGVAADPAGARQAARFLDSLTTTFGLPAGPPIDYYQAASNDESNRIVGLDYLPAPSGPGAGRGGRAFPREGIVISGDPGYGAVYRHELVHAALAPLTPEGGRLPLIEEGVATWLGGSAGESYGELLLELRQYQQRHPNVSIWALLDGEMPSGWGMAESRALYATGAMIVDASHRAGGITRLKQLLALDAGASIRRDLFEKLLGVKADGADRWWRAEVGTLSAAAGTR